MKEVVGIYCGNVNGDNELFWDSDVYEMKGLGGSETWAVEIGKFFQKNGYHTIIFGNPEVWHFDKDGVEYVPYYYFEHRCQYQHFDYLIVSRRVDILSCDEIYCKNIFLMSHEIGLFDRYWGIFMGFNGLHMDKVQKIAVLSEWHKQAMIKMYPQLKETDFFITCNGVNQRLYSDVDVNKKENMMVWSTCLNRGLTFFGQRVYPKIKQVIPSFKLKICSYNTNVHGIIPEDEGIEFLGTLSKRDLSEMQKKAKIWMLPNYGFNDFGEPLHESFCITAVENASAKNAVICFDKDGLKTTMKGCSGIISIPWFDDNKNEHTENEYEQLSQLMADKAIEYLLDDNLCRDKAEESYEIGKKYTWDHAGETWLREFKLCRR